MNLTSVFWCDNVRAFRALPALFCNHFPAPCLALSFSDLEQFHKKTDFQSKLCLCAQLTKKCHNGCEGPQLCKEKVFFSLRLRPMTLSASVCYRIILAQAWLLLSLLFFFLANPLPTRPGCTDDCSNVRLLIFTECCFTNSSPDSLTPLQHTHQRNAERVAELNINDFLMLLLVWWDSPSVDTTPSAKLFSLCLGRGGEATLLHGFIKAALIRGLLQRRMKFATRNVEETLDFKYLQYVNEIHLHAPHVAYEKGKWVNKFPRR